MRNTRVGLGLAAGLVALAFSGGSSLAGVGDEKTYWLGKGDKLQSRVEFKVSNGKIVDLLTGTGRAECSGNNRVSLWKSWDPFSLDGNSFEERESSKGDRKYFVAGHLRGSKASGRLKSQAPWFDEFCQSDFVQWTAEQVTKEEWDAAHEPH